MPKRNPQTAAEIEEARAYYRERMRRRRAERPEEERRRKRELRRLNRDEVNAKQRAYYHANKEKAAKWNRAYRAAHREAIRARKKRYHQLNPDIEKNWRCYAKKLIARRLNLLPSAIPDDLAEATLAYLRVRRELRDSHCINGHEYTKENAYRDKAGARRCRECNRQKARRNGPRYRARLRAAQGTPTVGGDVKQAPFMGGPVAEGHAPRKGGGD